MLRRDGFIHAYVIIVGVPMTMLGSIYQFLFQMLEMGFSCGLDVQYCVGWLSTSRNNNAF